MNYPNRWVEYTQTSKKLGLEISEAYSAWASRFRAAKALKGMVFKDLSEASQSAYFVAQKLTMADTAIEAFEQATGLEVGTIGIFQPDLAFELWDVRLSELTSLMSKIENRKLRLAFEAFRDLDKDQVQESDLRFVLRAFRHANSHGIFNPAQAELYRAKNYTNTLIELADKGLAACESEFTKLLDSGILVSDLTVEMKARHFGGYKHMNSVHVAAIASIDVIESGLLIKRKHAPGWQLIDFQSMTLGDVSFEESQMPLPKVILLDESVLKAHLDNLENISASSFVTWSLPSGLWVSANKEKFLLYDPETGLVLKRFPIAKDFRPYFLNDPKLCLTADQSGALVPMSDKTLFLDFDSGISKVIDIDLEEGAVYSSEIDAFISRDIKLLDLDFYAPHEISIASKTIGKTTIFGPLTAEEIIAYPKSSTCVIHTGEWTARLVSVDMENDEVTHMADTKSALQIDRGRFLMVNEDEELLVLPSDGSEPQELYSGGDKLWVSSYANQQSVAAVLHRWTNRWLRLNTEKLTFTEEIAQDFESLQQLAILSDGSQLLLGVVDEKLFLSHELNEKSLFGISLPGVNTYRSAFVLNDHENLALVWSRYNPALYLVDLGTGQVAKQFEFGSGLLDIVWSIQGQVSKVFITLLGCLSVEELDHSSGDLSTAFSLPNPGLSMRVSEDRNSLAVLTSLQSHLEASSASGGWLVKCSLI